MFHIKYHTTFQRDSECLLGYYYKMMNSESNHKTTNVFKQDIALSYDQYQDDLHQVCFPFTYILNCL